MVKKLIFNCWRFEDMFDDIEINSPEINDKQSYIEQLLIDKINKYNKKLDIKEVKYELLYNQFPDFKKDGRTGAIVEDILIDDKEKSLYENKGYHVFINDETYYARHILKYIFMTPSKEQSRNIFISQSIFPALADYMEDNLPSPSYSAANHGFILINIVNRQITAASIMKTIALLLAAGMDYITLFDFSALVKSDIPNDLKSFLRKYDGNKFNQYYNEIEDIYENKYYTIDFYHKVLTIKTDDIISNLVNKNGYVDFNGSDEKFYWAQIYPISVFAYQKGYKIDYSEYESFCNNYQNRFSPKSKKISRCKVILAYLKKYLNY